jgi:hypothetical protein
MWKMIINEELDLNIYNNERNINKNISFEWDNVSIKDIFFKKNINLWINDNKDYIVEITNCTFDWDINFDLN